jgi:hypothetical protein
VTDRTAELERVNRKLRAEVQERTSASSRSGTCRRAS